MELKKGDVLFSYGTGFIQRLIEWFTQGASHCAILSDDKGNIIEADGMRNVGYSDITRYSTNIRIYRMPNTEENINLGIVWLLAQFGRHYSYWDIFVLVIRCIFKLNLPWKESRSIICSRLVRDFLYESKLNFPDVNVTPRDIEDWIILNNGVLIIDSVSKNRM